MVTGNPMDKVVVIEAQDAWTFSNEVNSVLQQDPLFYIGSSYVDTYMYKAILIKRDIVNDSA